MEKETSLRGPLKMNNFNIKRYILYETVDKDVQSMFLPFDVMQYIMCCPKYRIKNDFIVPNSFISNVGSIIGTLVFIFSFVYRTYMVCLTNFCVKCPSSIVVNAYFDFIVYSLGFVMNFTNGIFESKNSIKFVIAFQRVHRFLNNETGFHSFIICNWIILFVYLCCHIAIFTTICVFLRQPFYITLCINLVIVIDFNVIYAARIINILESKVCLWGDKILNTQEFGDMNEEFLSNEMFDAYIGILECYDLHKLCYQRLVSIVYTYKSVTVKRVIIKPTTH